VFLAPGTGAVAAVAGRRVGGAVERNRARRILRAAWHELGPRIGPDLDAVLVATPAIRGARSHDLTAEMIGLIEGHR
jgi:ribonuclease P protein component